MRTRRYEETLAARRENQLEVLRTTRDEAESAAKEAGAAVAA